ncbi:hypothetical protein GPECTOR_7g982 [Gonium pectorale]|uniref:Uncharacterized protein n=1 Tax=Gonium pectorale TaxID=33097 RepID=A0A150GV07_GONPE|nr:hypothetical protein GPECTOR_7g982 [Gonium pectorale]|eukprot:KXZ53532.1 hypothetical protein GPECTOR_7g982 [Gonium pectorale]
MYGDFHVDSKGWVRGRPHALRASDAVVAVAMRRIADELAREHAPSLLGPDRLCHFAPSMLLDNTEAMWIHLGEWEGTPKSQQCWVFSSRSTGRAYLKLPGDEVLPLAGERLRGVYEAHELMVDVAQGMRDAGRGLQVRAAGEMPRATAPAGPEQHVRADAANTAEPAAGAAPAAAAAPDAGTSLEYGLREENEALRRQVEELQARLSAALGQL